MCLDPHCFLPKSCSQLKSYSLWLMEKRTSNIFDFYQVSKHAQSKSLLSYKYNKNLRVPYLELVIFNKKVKHSSFF